MPARGKELVGPIIGILGSIMLFFGGFLRITFQSNIQAELEFHGLTWADIGVDPLLLTLGMILTISFAILGIIGALLGFIGKRIPGSLLMLLAGSSAAVGMFVPLGLIDTGTLISPIMLSYTYVFLDPYIILLGGILGLALKRKE